MSKKFILPLALFIILILPIKITYANTNKNLNFDTTIKGDITDENKEDKYKIVLNKSGKITININSYINHLNMDFLDCNENIIEDDTISSGSEENPKIYKKSLDLDAGIYYIKMSENHEIGSYTLKVDYKEVKNDSIEPNNGTITAQLINLNSNPLNGFISVSNKQDFYKIVLPKCGEITINTNVYLEEGLYLDFLNCNGNRIEESIISGGREDNPTIYKKSLDLDAGTYYIKMSKSYGTGSYTLKVDYKEVKNDSIEPNNGTVTAQPINLNSNTINGFITITNDKDFYKIVLPEDGKLDVDFSVYMQYFTVKLLDENGKVLNRDYIFNGSKETPSIYNKTFDLKNGVYYLVADKYSPTGRYTFKVSTQYSVDQLYRIAYKASNNAVNLCTQQAINDARKAINNLKGTGASWAIGQLSGQVDKAQNKILINIITSIKKAENSLKQEDINKAKIAIDPNMPDNWKNSYSSAIDSIQNKLIKKATDAYKKAKETQLKVDIDNANLLILDIKKSNSNAIVKWANEYFK